METGNSHGLKKTAGYRSQVRDGPEAEAVVQVPGAFGLSAPPFFTYGFCLAVRQSCNSSGHHFHIPDRKQEGERWEQKGYHKPQAV